MSDVTPVRSVVLISIFFLLASCSPDHRDEDVRTCIAMYPPSGQSQGRSEEMHDTIGDQVAECMKSKGYRRDMADARCIDDVDFNKYCYAHR